jgi:hypothetical protein
VTECRCCHDPAGHPNSPAGTTLEEFALHVRSWMSAKGFDRATAVAAVDGSIRCPAHPLFGYSLRTLERKCTELGVPETLPRFSEVRLL